MDATVAMGSEGMSGWYGGRVQQGASPTTKYRTEVLNLTTSDVILSAVFDFDSEESEH